VETWLLLLRGDALKDPPESVFDRNQLKRLFQRRNELGLERIKPPEDLLTAEALALLRREGAVTKLRERRSFQLFEEQLAGWK
jgi:hypothetical protein